MHYPTIGRCWHCGHDLNELDFTREGTCPGCGKFTHACRNCRWYERGRPNDCREPVAEHVADKERANFCGYFEPGLAESDGEQGAGKDAMRRAAEDLFK
jgi:predicted RNA-binding Zn-ribbon protein involved in translation (DUF1610 family)